MQPGDGVPPGRPQALDLFGHQYGPGRQSLVVSYSAGYAVQNETQTVPAAAPFQLSALFALRTVGIGSRRDLRCDRRAPDAGFSLAGRWANMWSAPATYTFSAADAGQSVSISYGYVPQDIAQATLGIGG